MIQAMQIIGSFLFGCLFTAFVLFYCVAGAKRHVIDFIMSTLRSTSPGVRSVLMQQMRAEFCECGMRHGDGHSHEVRAL